MKSLYFENCLFFVLKIESVKCFGNSIIFRIDRLNIAVLTSKIYLKYYQLELNRNTCDSGYLTNEEIVSLIFNNCLALIDNPNFIYKKFSIVGIYKY